MWFTETPWPPIIICTILAVLLIGGWYAQGRGKYLVGVLLLVIASALIYVVELQIVTPREQVEANVMGLTSAFQRGDAKQTLAYISPAALDIRKQIEIYLQYVKVEDDLTITDLDVRLVAAESRALSHFRANATVSVGLVSAGRQPTRWELTWQREEGEWRVVRVDRLNPISGESMNLGIQSGY